MEEKRWYLQNRWVLRGRTLYYYGLRRPPHLFDNTIRLSKKQAAIAASLPGFLSEKELAVMRRLCGEVLVQADALRRTPQSFAEARFCRTCLANDFMIPGMELDSAGRCPMCATEELHREMRSLVPIVTSIPRARHSRFDAAVFYTGGKDSTYILYQLSQVQKLRVLALTWETPFMSESAKKSIEGAKTRFPNVEFLSRRMSDEILRRIYRKLYEKNGNTCVCPSLAYLLFYPELVQNRVPYFVTGNEPVQMLGLYYNHIAPRMAFCFAHDRLLHTLMNVGRILTLRPPLGVGQFHTLMTMKQLAWGDHPVKRLSGYENTLVSGMVAAIHAVPELLPPFRKSTRFSSRTGHIPAFVSLDMDALCGGVYDGEQIKSLLVRECGWVPPKDRSKVLHTSCQIERCKDQTQFLRFYRCESTMIPFSALEFALSSRHAARPREELLYEMEHCLGFSLDEVPECAVMGAFLEGEP